MFVVVAGAITTAAAAAAAADTYCKIMSFGRRRRRRHTPARCISYKIHFFFFIFFRTEKAEKNSFLLREYLHNNDNNARNFQQHQHTPAPASMTPEAIVTATATKEKQREEFRCVIIIKKKNKIIRLMYSGLFLRATAGTLDSVMLNEVRYLK